MDFKPFISSVLRACNMTASGSVSKAIERHLESDVKGLIKLAEAVASSHDCKTVKLDHVKEVAATLPKPSQRGGRVAMASEYFGVDSGRYGADGVGASTEAIDFENGIARAEVAQSVLSGGGKKVKGGRVSLPSEYFGVDSGRYGADGSGASTETIDFANGIARAEVAQTIMAGGTAMPSVPKSVIKCGFKMRVSKDALEKIQSLLDTHVKSIMKDLRGKVKGATVITDAKIERVFGMKRYKCFQ